METQCPHLTNALAGEATDPAALSLALPCGKCGTADDTWVCLTCREAFCSRQHNRHILTHHNSAGATHCVFIGLQNGYVWCLECNNGAGAIVVDARLRSLQQYVVANARPPPEDVPDAPFDWTRVPLYAAPVGFFLTTCVYMARDDEEFWILCWVCTALFTAFVFFVSV